MTNSKNILLVEDDPNLGLVLNEFLKMEGFSVSLARDGEKGFESFSNSKFDLCLLDCMMPKMDGFTLGKKIREINQEIPIIFLTAKSLKEDKLKGFDLGGDDYITKPFDEDELWCKIVAISKRSDFIQEETETVYQVGAYEFDYENLSLSLDGNIKRLTTREAEVLRMLCKEKKNVVRREQILTAIWGENDYFAGRSLDVFISKLRKYFAGDPSISIENVVKVGYILHC